MRKAAGAVPVVFALAAAFFVGRGGSSRESLIPLSRAVAEHGKALDRGAALAFPLSADEERAIGERLDASMRDSAPPAPGTPRASREALWRELGPEAEGSALVRRFRGRYVFRSTSHGGLNAFAVPGGFVYATDALLEKLAKDPDALLFVLAHEIAHIELGHTADAYRLRGAKDPLRAVVGAFASVARVFASLHFSPSQELEADAYAVRLLRSIGRDPAAGLRTFDALGLKEGSRERLSDYFSTHPGAWERRAALERESGRTR
ncbi:MAG: M48 family metallopeptidase [Elusimicrobiota bacterium]|nr:MAG: M48 family metallopeptidase [Elusimicrobiota bacterium]